MRNRIKLICTVFLLVFITQVHSECDWISEVDKEYRLKNPVLYGKVKLANEKISSSNGRQSLLHEAELLLSDVINADNKYAPAYIQYARLMSKYGHQSGNRFSQGELKTKEQYLQRALSLSPGYDYALALMGFTKMFQGDLEAATDWYRAAEAAGTKYPYLGAQLAQLSTKKREYDKAIEIATRSYEEHTNCPDIAVSIINEIIFAYSAKGNDFEIVEYWQKKRLELDPSIAWNWGDYSKFLLFDKNDYEAAIVAAEKALSLMNYKVGRRLLAAAMFAKWAEISEDPIRVDEAEKLFNQAKTIYPDNLNMAKTLSKDSDLLSVAKKIFKYDTELVLKNIGSAK